MSKTCNEAVVIAMHALPVGGAGVVRGQFRRELIRCLAAEGSITIVDRAGQPYSPNILSHLMSIADDLIYVPTDQASIIAQAVEQENKRLLQEQRERWKEGEKRRRQEQEEAMKRHDQWLTSLPRYTRKQAEAAGLDTRTGWYRRGLIVPGGLAENVIGLLNGRYYLHQKSSVYRGKSFAVASGLDSETGWKERGRNIKAGSEPKAHVNGAYVVYGVYSEDQTEPRRRVTVREAEQIDLLAAVWVINRHAKRCRDAARHAYDIDNHGRASGFSARKAKMYDLKSQVLHYLVTEGRLMIGGFHKFGSLWAEVLHGEEYTYHRPCPPPETDIDAKLLDDVEAKPRGAKEPRLKDALHTIEVYLADKEKVEVYQWPRRIRARWHDEEWDDDDFDEDEEWDDGDDFE